MPRVVEYWRPSTRSYQAARPGIAVLTDHPEWPGGFPAAFRGEVHNALRYIYATPTGTGVLNALAVARHQVTIGPASQPGMGNQIAFGNDAALNDVAYELTQGAGLPGPNTRAAVTTAFGDLARGARALADLASDTPLWTLNGVPGGGGTGVTGVFRAMRSVMNRWSLFADPRYFRVADTNEGYFNDQLWVGDPWRRPPGAVRARAADIATWLGGAALPAPLNNPRAAHHIALVTIANVFSVSRSRGGSAADIRWDTSAANVMNSLRPPAIGLGHELIHAMWTVYGLQPGRDIGHFSTTLFEFRCVGLGPWDEALPSENSLRREWWSHASPLIPPADTLNRKVPPKRIQYS